MKKIFLLITVIIVSCARTNHTDHKTPKTLYFENLPEGIVVNIEDLYNNNRLHIRKFNSSETVKTLLDNNDYDLIFKTFIEGDTIKKPIIKK